MTALVLFPSRVRFVNQDGTLTPEAYRALQEIVSRTGGTLGAVGTDTFGDVVSGFDAAFNAPMEMVLQAGTEDAAAAGGSVTTGTATIDFGAFPGSNEASVAVTGQTSILITSKVQAYVMGDDTTSDHTASDHRYFETLVGLACGTPTASTGFTIYARSTEKLQGTFALRWAWLD